MNLIVTHSNSDFNALASMLTAHIVLKVNRDILGWRSIAEISTLYNIIGKLRSLSELFWRIKYYAV